MSLQAKTSYVRPHTKTSYIRPLSNCSENDYKQNDPSPNLTEAGGRGNTVSHINEHDLEKEVKHIENTKENQLLKLNSAHHTLLGEIEKIHAWKASVELECQQKAKKLNELSRITESQRKVVLDLQMQNENLSVQLNDEIYQRTFILEKFNSYKELCSTLKRKFQDLEGQFDSNNKLKEAITKSSEEKIKKIEDLTKSFNEMCLEYAEKVSQLNDAWEQEKKNTLLLKDLCEHQSMTAEREHASYCKLIEKYQEEMKNASEELKTEKLKSANLEQEKNNLLLRISQLEDMNESNLKKMSDINQQLQLSLESKEQFEDLYKSENIKVHDLNIKCQEIEELSNRQKSTYEERISSMNKFITDLEHALLELKQKIKEHENKNEELIISLQRIEDEKNSLEKEISEMKREKEVLKEQIMVDGKKSESVITELGEENSQLKESLETLKQEFNKTSLENESLMKLCLEKESKLVEITDEYHSAVLKIKELTAVEENYLKILKDVEELQDNLQQNIELLSKKEAEIEELEVWKEKYNESLIKINDMENALAFKLEEILLKDKKIEEMNSNHSKNTEDIAKRIKELESEILTKNELLDSKILEIEELTIIKEKYDSSLLKIKELEKNLMSHSELLDNKDKMIEDFKVALRENENKLDKLEYENTELKIRFEDERNAVNVCLECEIMKDQVKECENLKSKLLETEQELMNQTQKAIDIMKMLSETEDNFDNMRIKKEKEIIKYKDTIQTLEHELKLLEIQVGETENLKNHIEKLQRKIEEIILQNGGDLQRLKEENEKLKFDIETLKSQSNNSLTDEDKTLSRKKIKKSPFREVDNKKMEADSSYGKAEQEARVQSSLSAPKKLCRQANTEIMNTPSSKTTSAVEREKKVWGSPSSGSDCLEIVFDSSAEKVAGLTPKRTSEVKSGTLNSSKKLNFRKCNNEKFSNFVATKEEKGIVNSKTVSSYNKRDLNTSDKSDFLKSNENVTMVYVDGSPWLKRKPVITKGPSTPVERKFFKTPLKERENVFRKPQSPWF